MRWALTLPLFWIATTVATAADSPIRNVLFLISDDLRANVLGCYGNPICHTPHIDALAARGMVFERSYCQGTVCRPSRLSLMYSRYRGNGSTTLGEHFIKHGRYSARVGKIFHMRVPGDIIAGTDGLDVPACWNEAFNSQGLEAHTPGDYACLNLNVFTTELEGRQSTKMPHRMYVSVRYEGDGSDQPDHKTASKTIELLEEHHDRPFFIAAGFVRPHYPMVAPHRFFERYPRERMRLPRQVPGDLEDIPLQGIPQSTSEKNGIAQFPENQKRMWAAYFAAVTFMDEQVGRIVAALDRLGLRENTAIVFTSDHGYHLGDHTFWLKNDLHEQVTRVPLIIDAPGFAPGRSSAITELVDLYPTLCELTKTPPPADLQGSSLVPTLTDPRSTLKEGALSFAKGKAWRTKHWAYMRYPDGSEELYDMREDPGQFSNLAGDPHHQETLEAHRNALDERLARIEKPNGS
jgi:iduronate 2-sulfatase